MGLALVLATAVLALLSLWLWDRGRHHTVVLAPDTFLRVSTRPAKGPGAPSDSAPAPPSAESAVGTPATTGEPPANLPPVDVRPYASVPLPPAPQSRPTTSPSPPAPVAGPNVYDGPVRTYRAGTAPTEPLGRKYKGHAVIPQQVYYGDSCGISIDLQPVVSGEAQPAPSRSRNPESQGRMVPLAIQSQRVLWDGSPAKLLEIELQAAGLKIDGARKQQQNLQANQLSYYWNCYFQHSGVQELSLIIRLIGTSGSVQQLGVVTRRVKVAKIWSLTQRQVEHLTRLGMVATGGMGIASALHSFFTNAAAR